MKIIYFNYIHAVYHVIQSITKGFKRREDHRCEDNTSGGGELNMRVTISHVTCQLMASRHGKLTTKGPVNWPY